MEALSEKLFDLLARIPKNYYLPILIGMLGMIFFGIGLIQLIGGSHSSGNISLNNGVTGSPESSPSAQDNSFFKIQIDVEGAVLHPGVYSLPTTARVQDGLIAAGGLSATADRETIAKQLNLAAKLSDGVKLYIPTLADRQQAQSQNSVSAGVSSSTVLGSSTALININTASEQDLDSLPGIGPVTAQKIMNARPFSTVNDLLTKSIVSKSVFEKIKDLVSVN